MAAAVAVAIIALAGVIGNVWAIEAGDVVEELRSGKLVDADRLRMASDTSLTAARLTDPARNLTNAVTAMAALPQGGRPAQQVQGEELIAIGRRALAEDPSNPYNWSRVAWARNQRGDAKGAVAALELSMQTGPHVVNIAAWRARLAYELMAAGERGLGDVARDQVVFAARYRARDLAQFNRDAGFVTFCHRVLVGRTPEHLNFIKALQAARRNTV
ncbi:hypothetical protein [Novosphingobium jiangmenense]|uniref:Uncharacterized protein n=1 Tax=Novosphingobium jiangmenense TaxID=2791981 RepID=A0ABS0HC02_9SPHN|nr:hypothetical protein [Novosphingobium jiangmenense]MBF9149668.1 hypothetical protein [Novosphingobium jiangmenense]